mmetsp:Transcript_72584/g.158452  ORF Transcript_72584/g.158452 Transcript_72584/m.158452 type:complete len:463 (+) Transcript_72584:3-1391(+)
MGEHCSIANIWTVAMDTICTYPYKRAHQYTHTHTDERYVTANTWTLYMAAFHWSFAHLLLGEMDIVAKNPMERVYSVVILMVGLMVFSSFVSSITEYMSRIAQMKAEKTRVDLEVRRFMEDHSVSARLSAQIFRYRKHLGKRSNREILPRDSIVGLQDLPKGLATLLSLEVYMKPLIAHAFFNRLYEDNHEVFALAVHQTMSEIYCNKGRELFQKGQRAETVLIVVFGEGSYLRDGLTTRVEKGEWISEHALWLGGWKRRGDMEVNVSMEVCALNIESFREFCLSYISIGLKALAFAESVANEKIPYSQLDDVGLDLASREALLNKAPRGPSASSTMRSTPSPSASVEVLHLPLQPLLRSGLTAAAPDDLEASTDNNADANAEAATTAKITTARTTRTTATTIAATAAPQESGAVQRDNSTNNNSNNHKSSFEHKRERERGGDNEQNDDEDDDDTDVPTMTF